jgi:hypothetical protein
MMRRILLLATVAVMMAAMLAVTAGAASATIHRLSCAEHSDAGTQDPPGITDGDFNGNNAPASNPALIVDEDAGTPLQKDTVGEDESGVAGGDGHSNAVKPTGCPPPGP